MKKTTLNRDFAERERNVSLQKFHVCVDCLSVGTTDPQCVCAYDKYKTIELEFEVCGCCGNLIEDGNPAETDFNKKKMSVKE